MAIQVALVGKGSVKWRQQYNSLVEVPVAFIPFMDPSDPQEVALVLARAEVVVGPWPSCAAPNHRVRLVQSTGAGVEHYDKNHLPETAFLCNVYEHDGAIAEYVFMALLALRRDLMRYDTNLQVGNWGTGDPVPDIADLTLGVVGFGRIGRALIAPSGAFGMSLIGVTGHEPGGAQPDGVRFLGGPGSLDLILSESDVLVVSVPQTDQTIGLIGARELALMKRSAILINVGRGPVVDETALYDVLSSGRLAGAALDVWYRYPETDEACLPANLPFHELPNVLMTPHQAGLSEHTYARRRVVIANNIDRVSKGERPLNIVWEPKANSLDISTSPESKEL